MKRKHNSCGSGCDRLPTMSAKYPWLVAQNLKAEEDDTKDQIFYAMNDPLSSHYWCRIPELLGRRIRGHFHGWVILSNHPHNDIWSLWNPMTSKTIHLPPLNIKDGESKSIIQCCLSSPPDDPTSVLMLTRTKTRAIIFCELGLKRKRLRWKNRSYAKQFRRYKGFLHCLTCCNGKVYALVAFHDLFIQVDIVVKDKEVVISLLELGYPPSFFHNGCMFVRPTLKGYCTELFYIQLGFDGTTMKTVGAVYLYKWDWTSMIWQEMEDLKNAIFFVNLAHRCTIYYRHAIASELGGYIHILADTGKVLFSYNVKDKTISLSSMSCLEPSTHLSLWEWRLHNDHGAEFQRGTGFKPEDDKEDEIKIISVRDDEVDINNIENGENFEPHLLNIPIDVLNMAMAFCVGVEYLNFRATCKRCQLAAPMIRWSHETAVRRLQTYSLISPWLIVLDKLQCVITFIDPMFGDKYFITTPQELIGNLRICSSRYGWLLLYKYILNDPGLLFFFNPFTNDIRQVPSSNMFFDSVCFSAPPTSPDCIVVGLVAVKPMRVFVYCINQESSWRLIRMDFGGTTRVPFHFSTFYGQDVYALYRGALDVFREIEGRPVYNGAVVEAPRGKSARYFLVSCCQHLLLVVMDDFGESVEVLKLNDSTREWEKIDSLGRHVIYICGSMCLCMEAKTPEMENKIYFPRLHSKSGKIIFYSLETCRYHTLNGRNIQHSLEDFFGTTYYFYPHAWIEPSWS